MSRKRYTDEFKAAAVQQVVERGYSVSDVAKRLGVSDHSLYKWVRLSGHSRAQRSADDLEAMRRENIRLKSELKRAEEERDVLKKAAAYFARTSG